MSAGEQSPAPAGSISIDQLLALNQEIVALVRAKVPLERGLAVAARDLKGKLKSIAGGLSRRLTSGESLADALAGEGKAIPPLYRAVVEAGARSGKLAVALEGLERYVRGYSEARAAVGLALWYPLLVFTLAYALFVGLVSVAIPRFVDAFQSLGLAIATPLHWLAWIGESAHFWWPIGPVLLVIVAIGWLRSGTAAQFQARSWTWLKIFPWMRALLAHYETANFADLLALLLEQNVPYQQALVLAAEATGNKRMASGARAVAEAIARGDSPASGLARVDRQTFLPMLRWVLATGQEQGSLVSALHNLGELYRQRGQYEAQKLTVFLPMLLIILVGAGATAIYALALFVPLINLLSGLSFS
jgi:type II secretory pathway component PulF